MAAEASESDEGADAPERTVQVVEFMLGPERFAIDVGEVDSIVDLEGSTRVPRTTGAVDGVMDLRGEITAVINPRVFLDVADDADEHQVLVLDQDTDKQKLGLRVDLVVGVEEYGVSRVDAPETFDELDTTGIREEAIDSIIRRPVGDDFDPVARLDVTAIIEASRQGTGVTTQ